MAEVIKFVHGDTAPQLKLTITDSVTEAVVNLTGYTVTMYIRPVNSTTLVLTKTSGTIPGITITNAAAGECIVTWGPNDLKLPATTYEAEIELYNATEGIRETIYDLLSLSIRDEVGPVPSGV